MGRQSCLVYERQTINPIDCQVAQRNPDKLRMDEKAVEFVNGFVDSSKRSDAVSRSYQ